MKILFICQYYRPEPFRHPDICEELVKRGHEVTVVTGLPNYPMGIVLDEYRHGKKREELLNGVKVHRCFTIGRRQGGIFRFLNYYSYAVSSTCYIRRIHENYDVVYVHQLSPVMMANAALSYKKRKRVPIVLYCLDLWPESLIAGGIKKDSRIYKYFHYISKKIYRRADRILVTSRSFSDYFKEQFDMDVSGYLPQYAEDLFQPEQCRKEKNEFIDLMFAGNIGAAQKVDTIIQAAKLTSDIPNLRWHIVGDGSEISDLKHMARDVENVIFYGRKSLEEMPSFYSMADAMLVTMQKDPVLSLTLPGKIQTYMAAGKPIIGAIDGETALVIQEAGCGLCGEAENAELLALNVRKFVQSTKESFGVNARAYYDAHFSKGRFVDMLENELSLVSGKAKNEDSGV